MAQSRDFKSIINVLPGLKKKLLASPLFAKKKKENLFARGIFVFYEKNKPLYVGRSNRLREQLLENGRPSSPHNLAPLAFNIARKEAKKAGIKTDKKRTKLAKDARFIKLFSAAKKRVAKMDIRAIEIKDPVVQAIFEVYASIELKTEYNDFNAL